MKENATLGTVYWGDQDITPLARQANRIMERYKYFKVDARFKHIHEGSVYLVKCPQAIWGPSKPQPKFALLNVQTKEESCSPREVLTGNIYQLDESTKSFFQNMDEINWKISREHILGEMGGARRNQTGSKLTVPEFSLLPLQYFA